MLGSPLMEELESKNILVLGGIFTGKSSIIRHLKTGVFNEEYVSAVKDCCHVEFQFEGKLLHLQIFDISGFEDYSSLKDQATRRADGIILVYNITQGDTFSEAKRLAERAQRIRDSKIIPMVLVGCMLDLEYKRIVKKEDGEELALKLQCPFREISAKDRDSIVEVFTLVLQEIDRPRADALKKPRRRFNKKSRACCTLI